MKSAGIRWDRAPFGFAILLATDIGDLGAAYSTGLR